MCDHISIGKRNVKIVEDHTIQDDPLVVNVTAKMPVLMRSILLLPFRSCALPCLICLVAIAIGGIREVKSAFTASYTFRAEDCSIRKSFTDEQTTRAPLGALFAVKADCLPGQLLTDGFPSASNGISLRNTGAFVESDWTVANILESFSGDVFAIAIWYSLGSSDALADQVLLEIGSHLRITPIGAQLVIGGNIVTGNTTILPTRHTADAKTLLILSVGPKRGRLWRKSIEPNAVAVEGEFTLPEAFMTTDKVIIPRMASWSPSSRARVAFRGELFAMRFFDAQNNQQDALFRQGPPDYRPRCPSVRDYQQWALEHSTRIELSFANATVRNSAARIKYKVESLPLFGKLFDDNETSIEHVPTYAYRLSYIPDARDLLKNDSFALRAVNDTDELCESAFRGTISIRVIPVNDPPIPDDVHVRAMPRKGTSITLGGMDLDGDVKQMRGGMSRVTLEWSSQTFDGQLYYAACDRLANMTTSTIPSPINGSSFETPNGTGWPLEFCYYPTYETRRFSKSSGMEIVGTDTFFFKLIDDQGLASPLAGMVLVDVGNPSYSAREDLFVANGTEETVLKLNLTLPDVNVKEIWVVTNPFHGKLVTTEYKVFAGMVPNGHNELLYIPDNDFAGQDEFIFRMKNDQGYLSPPITMTLHIANTYDPSLLEVANVSLQTKSFVRTPVDVRLLNHDRDAYKVQAIVSLEDPATGLISIANLSSFVSVVRGSSCVDVGCHEDVVLEGLPTVLNQALHRLEFTAIESLDNRLTVEISDMPPGRTNWSFVDRKSVVILSLDSTVWGTSSTARGSATVGAAIIGSLISVVLVFGRGLWRFVPLPLRQRAISVCSKFKCLARRKHMPTPKVSARALLRPPSTPWKSGLNSAPPSPVSPPTPISVHEETPEADDNRCQHDNERLSGTTSVSSGSFEWRASSGETPRDSFEMVSPPSNQGESTPTVSLDIPIQSDVDTAVYFADVPLLSPQLSGTVSPSSLSSPPPLPPRPSGFRPKGPRRPNVPISNTEGAGQSDSDVDLSTLSLV